MKSYILSLDQGTSSSRAIIFDKSAHIIGQSQKEFGQFYPKESWVEQDPEEIWDSQLQVMRDSINRSKIKANQIAAIGITNQRETTVVWDRDTGKAIYPAIVWQDRRTAPECEKYKTLDIAKKIKDKTGLLVDAYFSATKIKWILDHVKDARKKAASGELAFGTVDSWLLYKLTNGAVHATDHSNASRTMLFNIKSCTWDEELCRFFDIHASMLPEVRDSSGIIAYTDPDIVGMKIPVSGIAGDQQAALFGQLCFEPGMLKNTYGTGCFIVMNTGTEIVDSRQQLLSTIAWKIGDEICYALEGSVFVAGAIIQWLRDGLRIISDAKETEALAREVEDTLGVYFVPALTGLGAPVWDSYARGTLLGISRGTKKAHIVRAALEGIAFQVEDVLSAMYQDTNVQPKWMKVDGGAVNNNFLMQFQSDISNLVLIRPKVLESTALGAAFLAGLSVGFWKDKESLKELVSTETKFSPQMSTKCRQQCIMNWKKAVNRSLDWAK